MEDFLSEHFRRDQCDAALRDVESPAVFIRVETSRETFRQYTALVRDGTAKSDMPVHDDVRQYHRILDAAVAVHAHVRKQQGALDRGSADKASTGYDRVHRAAAAAIIVEHELGRG